MSDYEVAKKRIEAIGFYFFDYVLMSPLLHLLQDMDPHLMCRDHLQAVELALSSLIPITRAALDHHRSKTVTSIAMWSWPGDPLNPRLNLLSFSRSLTPPLPDICVFFRVRPKQKANLRRFWLELNDSFSTKPISAHVDTHVDLKLTGLIPAEFARLGDEVHFFGME